MAGRTEIAGSGMYELDSASMEETEEQEVAGMEELEEDEIAGYAIGFSWKKIRKAFKKVAPVAVFPPLALARSKVVRNFAKKVLPVAAFPPLALARLKIVRKAAARVSPFAAFKLLSTARDDPGARKKIEAIKTAADISPEELAMRMKDEEGKPAPAAKVMEAKEMAQDAYANLEKAAEVQNQAYEDTGDFDAYDPPYYPPEGEYENVEGDDGEGLSLYEWGALAGMKDVLGFSFKKLIKSFGRTIDPTRAGSPFRAALQSVPGIGPQLTAAADMVAKARAGVQSAANKIQDVKDLANAGDPDGQKALANLKAANALSPPMKLHRIFRLYEFGSHVSV